MFVNSPSLMHSPLHSYLCLVREYPMTRQANVMRHRWTNGNCAFVCCVSNSHASTSITHKYQRLHGILSPDIPPSLGGLDVGFLASREQKVYIAGTHVYIVLSQIGLLYKKYVEHYLHTAPTFMESCPFPARRRRKTEWLSFTSGTPHIYIKHKTTVILYSRDICSNYNYIQTKWSKIRSILHTKR